MSNNTISKKALNKATRTLLDYASILCQDSLGPKYELSTDEIDHLGHDLVDKGNQTNGSHRVKCSKCGIELHSYSEMSINAQKEYVVSSIIPYEPDKWYLGYCEPDEKIPSCAEVQMENAIG